MADTGLVHVLDHLLRGRRTFHSIIDIGCGVGQLGHALLAKDERHRYWGCDSGNAARASGGFVHLCTDGVPVANWVLSVEVGEHVPPKDEAGYLRQLERDSCRGIIMSWASPGQGGDGHINQQFARQFVPKVIALGFAVDDDLTTMLRHNASLAWLSTKRDCRKVVHQRCNPAMGDQLTAFTRLRPNNRCPSSTEPFRPDSST